jgi:hypothetical protein
MKRFTALFVQILSFFCARIEAADEPGPMNVPPVAFRLPRNAPAPEFQAEGVKPKDTAKVFVGYLYGHPRHINFRLYTHLCHAFLVADEEGNVRKDRNVPSRDLTTKAHQAGVKVLLSLGGWGWDKQFAAIVSKPEAEDRYVKSVMAVITDNDYDGIDLDWEYPDNEKEITGFERLVRRFRKQLDEIGAAKGRPMLVTMAASSNKGTLSWLRKEFLLETMDWINVMTYDYTGNWTDFAGHHSPLFASRKQPGSPRSTALSLKYLVEERGLPADRLAVGIPLYGRGFAVSEPYASAPARKGLDAHLGRRNPQPLADRARPQNGDRLRRRRIGRLQDRMGHETRLPRRLLLADRRRPDARRHQPSSGSLAGETRREPAQDPLTTAYLRRETSCTSSTR